MFDAWTPLSRIIKLLERTVLPTIFGEYGHLEARKT